MSKPFTLSVGLTIVLISCSSGDERTTRPAEAKGSSVAAPGARAGAAYGDATVDDGQWTMPAKNYASTRYSPLNQITTANVANLRVTSTFSTGTLHGHEAAPLVVNNTMYIVTPFPNSVYALDLTKPGPQLKSHNN